MSLENQIMADIKSAMLAKDKVRLEALRAIKSVILLEKTKTGNKEDLNDDLVLKLIGKLNKQRLDAYDIYKEQERLLLEIRDFMTDVRLFENRVSKMLEKKPKNKKLISLDKELNTKEGTYMQPMLIDQIRYLQSMLSRADQKPGKDAYDRLEELKTEFNLLKDKLG